MEVHCGLARRSQPHQNLVAQLVATQTRARRYPTCATGAATWRPRPWQQQQLLVVRPNQQQQQQQQLLAFAESVFPYSQPWICTTTAATTTTSVWLLEEVVSSPCRICMVMVRQKTFGFRIFTTAIQSVVDSTVQQRTTFRFTTSFVRFCFRDEDGSAPPSSVISNGSATNR